MYQGRAGRRSQAQTPARSHWVLPQAVSSGVPRSARRLQADLLGRTQQGFAANLPAARGASSAFSPTGSVSSRPRLHVGCCVQCPARARPVRWHSPGPDPSSAAETLGRSLHVGFLRWDRHMTTLLPHGVVQRRREMTPGSTAKRGAAWGPNPNGLILEFTTWGR